MMTKKRDLEEYDDDLLEQLEPIDAFTVARLAIARWEREHDELMQQYAALKQAAMEAEDALRQWARANGPVANAEWEVTVTHPMRRSFDAEGLLKAEPWLNQVPGVVTTQTVVNRDKIMALVKNEMIHPDVSARFMIEEPMTPAVLIRAIVPKPR